MTSPDANHGKAVDDEDPDYSPMDDPAIQAAGDEMSAHPERHIIVCFRDGWQFTYRGQITGPFSARDDAVEHAIREARETKVPDIEVVVQDPDLRQETVWRNGASA